MAKRYAIIRVVAPGGGAASPLQSKGDVWVYSASGDTRLPAGANGQILMADSTVLTGLAWVDPLIDGAYGSGTYGGATSSGVSGARIFWED